MNDDRHTRTLQLIGSDGLSKLAAAKVAVIGLGGVGGIAAEMLVRSGIGELHLYDGDVVAESNLNRQIFATYGELGQPKASAALARLCSIHPNANASAHDIFVNEDNIDVIIGKRYNYIVDAIDSMGSKVALIHAAYKNEIPIISATGAGNRLRADMLEVADVYQTSGDPVCRILRSKLKKLGIDKHRVVYSKEEPMVKQSPPASMAFVPNVMGIMLANYVALDILER